MSKNGLRSFACKNNLKRKRTNNGQLIVRLEKKMGCPCTTTLHYYNCLFGPLSFFSLFFILSFFLLSLSGTLFFPFFLFHCYNRTLLYNERTPERTKDQNSILTAATWPEKYLEPKNGFMFLPWVRTTFPCFNNQPLMCSLYMHMRSGQKLDEGTTSVALSFWIG